VLSTLVPFLVLRRFRGVFVFAGGGGFFLVHSIRQAVHVHNVLT